MIVGMLLEIACGDYCYAMVKPAHGPVVQLMCDLACQRRAARFKGRRVRITFGPQPMVLNGPDDFQDGVLTMEAAR